MYHLMQLCIPTRLKVLRLFAPTLGSRQAISLLSCILTVAIVTSEAYAGKVYINPSYPIQSQTGAPALSPPHLEQTNECSTHVYVDSFVPGATIDVYRSGATLIGAVTPKEGFTAVPLKVVLSTGDSVTATQTVNGVTSAPSLPMIVTAMPLSLPPPKVDPGIYACGRIVPVHGLVSGVKVQVKDITTNKVIGSGSTPNLWGSDWDPVFTQSLISGDEIVARQFACTNVSSVFSSPGVPVQPEPNPFNPPTLDPPIIDNSTVTEHGLFPGAFFQAIDNDGATHTAVGSAYATTPDNWINISPHVRPLPHEISAEQTLCQSSGPSTPVPPTTTIPPVELLKPICPGASAAYVRNSTINATLVLLKNGVIVGYGGAAPGDVPLDITPLATFAAGDTVQVVEYIHTTVIMSNIVTVGCSDVITYHNDSERTGWNPNETTLTPANVNSANFGHIVTVPLDDEIDTQPLVVGEQNIVGAGTHTVAYVTTENNTVYALDAWNGDILKQQNLGAPVPMPLGCNNNGPNVGINGTQTIGPATHTIYVMAYTLVGGTPTYQLHALDPSTLSDLPGSPVTVSAVQTLSDGTVYRFNAANQRQRPALLQTNNQIYAGFGSFCDFNASDSRGWVLAWDKTTLAPISTNELSNRFVTAPAVDCTWNGNHPCFLSAVWMSGYGLASDSSNNLYFTTGNSASGTYNSTFNISETAAKMSGDLTTLLDFFTPSNVNSLDAGDTDYGSGGLLVLPDHDRQFPHLAAAVGKDGRLFVLDRDHMGGINAVDYPLNVAVGGCWCGPSYFPSSAGEWVVSSGGTQVQLWSPTVIGGKPSLSFVASASVDEGSQHDAGFFTSISTNGLTVNTGIIWAVGRAAGNDRHVTLWAFNATPSGSTLPPLWSGPAGNWPNDNGNNYIVPTVANGRVLVVSDKQIQIFGLTGLGTSPKRVSGELAAALTSRPPSPPSTEPQFWGTIRSVQGDQLSLELRSGRILHVDLGPALAAERAVDARVGEKVVVRGEKQSDDTFQAHIMLRAKGQLSWGKDSE
jgi:hypothetical protein